MKRIKIERYDILQVDLTDAVGSEQGKVRPCVVVSNDSNNKYSPVIIVMPFTSNINKKNIPTHKIISKDSAIGLTEDSLLVGEQPTPIDRSRIKRKMGKIISRESKNMIDEACYDAFFYERNRINNERSL